jgi:hypothetical protein
LTKRSHARQALLDALIGAIKPKGPGGRLAELHGCPSPNCDEAISYRYSS